MDVEVSSYIVRVCFVARIGRRADGDGATTLGSLPGKCQGITCAPAFVCLHLQPDDSRGTAADEISTQKLVGIWFGKSEVFKSTTKLTHTSCAFRLVTRTPSALYLCPASSGGDLDLKGAAPPRRSSRAAAAAAALAPLRQTAATALAAVLMLASTEQDIMTAMMGLDPSLATSTAAQPAMTLPKEEGPQAGGGKAPSMGSIDLRGQGDALGEIAGGPGGGFKNGRLMVDQDSDLAMMLGKKMKTPDADPLTH